MHLKYIIVLDEPRYLNVYLVSVNECLGAKIDLKTQSLKMVNIFHYSKHFNLLYYLSFKIEFENQMK